MIQIPYEAIAMGIAILLGIWAIIEAESPAGRLALAAAMLAIFFLPIFWRGAAGRLTASVCWLVFGIGCYLFVKLKGVAIR